jgi:hypothetical protein
VGWPSRRERERVFQQTTRMEVSLAMNEFDRGGAQGEPDAPAVEQGARCFDLGGVGLRDGASEGDEVRVLDGGVGATDDAEDFVGVRTDDGLVVRGRAGDGDGAVGRADRGGGLDGFGFERAPVEARLVQEVRVGQGGCVGQDVAEAVPGGVLGEQGTIVLHNSVGHVSLLGLDGTRMEGYGFSLNQN